MSSPFLSQDPDEIKAAIATSDAIWKRLLCCPLPTDMQRVVHKGLFWFGNHEFTIEGGYMGLTFCPLFEPDDKNQLGVVLELGQSIPADDRKPQTWWRIMFKGEILLICEDAGTPEVALELCTAAYCNLRYTCDALLATGERPEALRKHIENGLLDYDTSEWDSSDMPGVVSIFDLVDFPSTNETYWIYRDFGAFFCHVGQYMLMVAPKENIADEQHASWTVFYRSPRTERSTLEGSGTSQSLYEARLAALAYCSPL